MELINQKKEYRKFLKSSRQHTYKLGNYFPEKLLINNQGKVEDFGWIKKIQKGTIIFVMSQYCTSCNYDLIDKFSNTYTDFKYCMLLEANEKFFDEIKKRYTFSILKCDVLIINKFLKFDLLPWVFGLNNVGQIVAAGIFNEKRSIELIVKSLMRVYYPNIQGKNNTEKQRLN